jgi:RNA polymerase sigma factor (sigma-70 family)
VYYRKKKDLQLHRSEPPSAEKLHWQSMLKGESRGLEQLYERYADPLYNYGSKFTADKDLIKDCIQELFVNLWTRRSFISDPANVKNYLFKSFRLSVFKKTALLQKNKEYQEIENYPFQVSLSIEDELIGAERNEALSRKLEATLKQLTDRQREAIFLKFYEGLSYEEIAGVMGISVKASYKLMARALGFLKDHLSKDELMTLYAALFLKLFH